MYLLFMMNIGHGDSRYGEDMSSNNSAYGVSGKISISSARLK